MIFRLISGISGQAGAHFLEDISGKHPDPTGGRTRSNSKKVHFMPF
jgi:hypothetical protein